MNLRQTYHITSTARRCSSGSDWWGRHRHKGSWWGEGSTYPIATPIWQKRGYASATAGNSHPTLRGQHTNAKLVLEGGLVLGWVPIIVILVLTTIMIGATPPVITRSVIIT